MRETRKIQPMKPRPVPGAVAQWSALICAALAALFNGLSAQSGFASVITAVFLVCGATISVIRQIEADRRAGL